MSKKRVNVGNLLPIFSDTESLQDTVTAECTRYIVVWEKIDSETSKTSTTSEPEYTFPENLKFSIKPDLAGSYTAYKHLLAGFEEKSSVDAIVQKETLQLAVYDPLLHYDDQHHPLRQFQFPEYVRELLSAPSSGNSS